MLDLKFVRENPDVVKQNIKNKFQDDKLPLVDEVIELDAHQQINPRNTTAAIIQQTNVRVFFPLNIS